MYLLYITFFFSLSAVIAMVSFRLWELKNGKIPFPENAQLSKQLQHLSEWEHRIWEESKRLGMYFLSVFLRVAIVGVDKIRKLMRHAVSKMEESLTKKNASKDLQGSPSFFLKEIAEYKKKMRMHVREVKDKKN